jgi:hypothetical protein
LLLRGSEWSGAYYLVGYAVECGLKACLTKSFRGYQMPDKQIVEKGHTHDLDNLVRLAALDGILGQARRADGNLDINWALVKDWKETSRYETRTETRAVEAKEQMVQEVLLSNVQRICAGERGNLAFAVHRSRQDPREFWGSSKLTGIGWPSGYQT